MNSNKGDTYMQDLIKQVNSLPLIVKVLLCIPAVEIFYGICRIINQATKQPIDALYLVLAILTVFPGAFFMWIVDLVCVLMYGHACLLG